MARPWPPLAACPRRRPDMKPSRLNLMTRSSGMCGTYVSAPHLWHHPPSLLLTAMLTSTASKSVIQIVLGSFLCCWIATPQKPPRLHLGQRDTINICFILLKKFSVSKSSAPSNTSLSWLTNLCIPTSLPLSNWLSMNTSSDPHPQFLSLSCLAGSLTTVRFTGNS